MLALFSALLLAQTVPSPVKASPASTVKVVAVGDIAGEWPEDEATAKLAESLNPGAVILLGDLAYLVGAPDEFERFFAPTWGRLKDKTLPSPGNHDHGTEKLRGYCDYFGKRARCDEGFAWYETKLGPWRVISLDSGGKTPGSSLDGFAAGTRQRAWLRRALARTGTKCTLVFWHHPRFSSGNHGDDIRSKEVWDELMKAGVDVVLAGHDHHYERFAALNASGERDDARGIPSFIVGTGGAPLYKFNAPPKSTTVFRQADTHGVLELSLEPNAFSWRFVPVGGAVSPDSGRADCH